MPDGQDSVTVRVIERIAEVPAAEWDACAGTAVPFVRHAFLLALEESGSVTAKSGWLPQHLLIRDARGRLMGAAPLYLKSHSFGEYVFDWSWADAYQRAGGSYYPKLQGCVPFTPVTGPRLLVHPEADQDGVANALIAGMAELARQYDVSSLHVTFPREAEWRRFGEAGFLRRVGLQYHWRNRGYDSFDDFLGDLTARKRKSIKRERRDAVAKGLEIQALSGPDLKPHHWDAFYRFYMATADRKWGRPYLNRAFFAQLGESLADQVVLVLAQQDGRPVAGALNLVGGDTLYGRNWGCIGRFRFLHFELCYYQAMDYAIRHGLARVEAGAQGEHKIQRGYLPVETYSAHLIRDPRLGDAIAHFLLREQAAIEEEKAFLAEHGPFRCGAGQAFPG